MFDYVNSSTVLFVTIICNIVPVSLLLFEKNWLFFYLFLIAMNLINIVFLNSLNKAVEEIYTKKYVGTDDNAER